MHMSSENKVSIVCITYNHIEYIKDALEGIMNQKTTFKFNVFVFDDASTDGTSDIVAQYAKMYPDIVNAVISPVNTYNNPDRKRILASLYERFLTGKYIAVCEGDDCWINVYKLQKQVDFLENNKECSMVTHAYRLLDCTNNTFSEIRLKEMDGYLSPKEVILYPRGPLGTASLVMRRDVFFEKKGFPKCDVGDIPIHFRAIQMGKVYYLDELMSVYRYMHEGSWSREMTSNVDRLIPHDLKFIKFFIEYDLFTDKKFNVFIWIKIIDYLYAAVETAHYANMNEICNINIVDSKVLAQINRVLGWFNSNPKLTENERVHIEKSDHIYIMGKGKYSKVVKKSLDYLKCKIDGYVLSNRKSELEDTNTYSIDEISNDGSVLLIVGISQNKEEEILRILSEKKITNFIVPLWFRREDIFS